MAPDPTTTRPTTPKATAPNTFASTAAGCANVFLDGEPGANEFQYNGKLRTFDDPHFASGQITATPDARREAAPCRARSDAAPVLTGL